MLLWTGARIRFTLVNEPQDEGSEADCADVGVAFVSVPDILRSGRDLVNQDIPSMPAFAFL